MDDPNFVNIEVGNIITALPNKRDQIQAFVIEDITKPINGVVTIYATHIAQHRGKLIPVQPFTASDLDDAFYEIKTNSLEANPFTLVRDPGKANVTATMHPTAPHSFRELLGGVEGSILDTYRGEWGYDNFTITLYNKRGHDNGARVMYGRNMSDFHLEEQFNWNDSVTGVFGYWLGENGAITLSNIQYSQYADLYPYHKTVCVDFSDKFETQPSTLELDTYALSWINGKGLIGASVDVAYEHVNVGGGADVGIGDIVHIYNGVYDFEMESRIVGLEFDVLSEEYTNVSIGDIKTTLNEAISDINGGSMGSSGASVEPSTTTPKMDGTAAIGTEQKYARGDHVHPTDTTKVDKLGTRLTGNIPSGTSLADYCRTTNVPNGLSFWGIQNASDNPRPGIVGTALVYKPLSSGQYTVPLVFSSGIAYISTQLGASGGFTWRPVTGNTDDLQCTGESNITFSLNQAQKNGSVAIVALDFKSSSAKSAWTATGITVPTDMKPRSSRNIFVATNIGGSLAFTQWQVLDTGVIRLSRSMAANVQHAVTLVYLI